VESSALAGGVYSCAEDLRWARSSAYFFFEISPPPEGALKRMTPLLFALAPPPSGGVSAKAESRFSGSLALAPKGFLIAPKALKRILTLPLKRALAEASL
jgi:hypothetical protein